MRKARCAPEFAVRFQQYLTAPQRDMETRRARWAAVAAMCAVTAAVPRTPRARVARPTPLAARSLTIDGGAREADRDAVETENRERLLAPGVTSRTTFFAVTPPRPPRARVNTPTGSMATPRTMHTQVRGLQQPPQPRERLPQAV